VFYLFLRLPCFFVFFTIFLFIRHCASHAAKEFICTVNGCSKAYFRREALKRHSKVHSGDGDILCDFEGCNERFYEIHHLKRHKKKVFS